ncbi:ABC transporter substrate-binding protein [Neorhizobium sp. Rsf11]|uniref:ABC transporter substrate-binding protein n=2 Tax=Neorhizobium TaxID=1525371 RepID=A0ABV0MCE3_9HYPH|nr:ABC transporter substrate-binding protein [Neorhizobium petrolearium]MCC2613684.1 ABC transporter substrate-binding protein [Neorhizobium petrolearium]WGI71999.1 ABC transporter substrate-binding protein [Neorhizobium petrolearium]
MKGRTIRPIALATALTVLGSSGPSALAQDHPQDKPLVVGSDFGVAPWMVRGTNGPEGFGVDLITAISKKVGRPSVDIQDINFSGLFAALFANRIEFTVNPLNITQERSEKMLYTEPFFATGNGFIVAKGTKLDGFEGLKGKTVAVNRGTISDTWATQNAEKYGFEVQRYETFPDSVQAVITRRAFTALNEIPTTVYAASKNPAIEVGFKDFNGRNFGYAFRIGDEAYRDKVEAAIECLKTDGTMARLYEKWYGEKPAEGTSLTTVYVGYGAPGFKGHDEKPHDLSCN